jgi:hypothetical protein
MGSAFSAVSGPALLPGVCVVCKVPCWTVHPTVVRMPALPGWNVLASRGCSGMHRMPCWNSIVVRGLQQPAFVRELCWWALFIVRGEPGMHGMCPRYILSTDRAKLLVRIMPPGKLLCAGGQPVLHSMLSGQVLIFSVRQCRGALNRSA